MELDSLKAVWQSTTTSTVFFSNEELRKIMNNAHNTAMKKLIKWEQAWAKLLFICIPVFYLCLFMLYRLSDDKERLFVPCLFLGILYSLLCAGCILWQYYKVRYLKNTDLLSMDMVTLTKRMAVYRKYIVSEILVSAPAAMVMLVIFLYYFLGTDKSTGEYIFWGAYIAVLILIVVFIYRKKYFKRIRAIQQSLDEVKELQQ